MTTTQTTIRSFEKSRTGWDAILSDGRRISLRSSDGTGKVGSRNGGWSARRAGLVAHGDTREAAVRAWLYRDDVQRAQWATRAAARAANQNQEGRVAE